MTENVLIKCPRCNHAFWHNQPVAAAPATAEAQATGMRAEAQEIRARIKSYIGNGGLFNPEMMEHHKVGDLIMDMRDFMDKHLLAADAPASPDLVTAAEAVKARCRFDL